MNRRALPSLELLLGFEAAARLLSFTRAAAELCLTQSAVSRQVRQLEAQLGVRLFDRRARSMVLTAAGARYHAQVQRLLGELHEATQGVRGSGAGRALRVTTTPTFASLWLIPRLARFQRRQPQVQVHVVAENALRNLRRDDYHAAIRYSSAAIAGAGAVKLFDERLVPLCSPRLLRRKALRRPEDLRHFCLIHFNDIDGHAPWLSWRTWFEGIGRAAVEGKAAMHFSHYDQAVRAAVAGQGVALGRMPVADHLVADGRLVAPFGEALAVRLEELSYWLLLAERHRDRPEVQAFAAWLARNARPRAI